MSNLAVTNDLFFDRTGMDPRRVETIVGEALSGMDDGELFLFRYSDRDAARVEHESAADEPRTQQPRPHVHSASSA